MEIGLVVISDPILYESHLSHLTIQSPKSKSGARFTVFFSTNVNKDITNLQGRLLAQLHKLQMKTQYHSKSLHGAAYLFSLPNWLTFGFLVLLEL